VSTGVSTDALTEGLAPDTSGVADAACELPGRGEAAGSWEAAEVLDPAVGETTVGAGVCRASPPSPAQVSVASVTTGTPAGSTT